MLSKAGCRQGLLLLLLCGWIGVFLFAELGLGRKPRRAQVEEGEIALRIVN